jgi:hypothetical protein
VGLVRNHHGFLRQQVGRRLACACVGSVVASGTSSMGPMIRKDRVSVLRASLAKRGRD